jgi:hemolysin III
MDNPLRPAPLARVTTGIAGFSTALLLYSASMVYHAIQHQQPKAQLEIVDPAAISLLIAGTYAPLTLISLRGTWIGACTG